jgi:hypothetical protein
MLEDIRKSYGLTRNEVALLTGRSINYVLKAEQATFPSAPIALLAFYASPRYTGSFRLSQPWEPHDMELMRSDYRAFQRRKRRSWLETYEPLPYTGGLTFRHKWRRRTSETDAAWAVGAFDFQDRVNVYSSAYGLSVGLCLPAAVVYRNDKDLTKAGAIVTAMEDLVEYVTSGEYVAANYGNPDCLEEVDGVIRIAKEEGVKVHDRANGNTAAA